MNDRLTSTAAVSGLLLLAGLYCSLKSVMALASVDADSSHSLMLWFGITEHGWAWLSDWRFTQDNWLFSLFPWHFLGYFLAAPVPEVALLGGWLIFVLAAGVSGLIAWQLQARKAALLIPPVLLFLGLYAHVRGLAAYSTTHNITNLHGLIALYLLLRWITKPTLATLLLISLVLFAGSASDPWMLAAYNLPFAILAACLFVSNSGGLARKDCGRLFAAVLVTIAGTLSRFFGLLDFFPAMEFQSGGAGAIPGNFLLLVQELGALVNIVPGKNPGQLLPAVLSLLAVTMLLLVQLARAWRAGHLAPTDRRAFVVVSFFSIGGVALAFALNNGLSFSLSARFLVNFPYLVVIGLGVLLELNWKALATPHKQAAASVIALFVLAGITSTFPAWSRPGLSFNAERVTGIINFLRAENLTYGYGSYWGDNANAVTAASGQEIRMRPVTFHPVTGMLENTWRPQTSRRWYRMEDIPEGQQDFFVLVSAHGEECADVARCVSALSQQFGPPVRTLDYAGQATVLVWDQPLTRAWQP